MTCKYINRDGDTITTTVTWRVFYPRCPKVNNNNCSSKAGAYVSAVTVCRQRLF